MTVLVAIVGLIVIWNFIIWFANWCNSAASLHKERTRRKELDAYLDRIHAETQREFQNKYYRPNVLVLSEEFSCKRAYFKDGTVYAVSGSSDFIIGYYDQEGVVYSSGNKRIGSVSKTGGSDELIQLDRLGDLHEYRQNMFNKADEELLTENEKSQYYALSRNTSIAWTCARVWNFGSVEDIKTGAEIAKPEISAGESERNAVGYGACFICLQHLATGSGKYAGFYSCPLGTKYSVD